MSFLKFPRAIYYIRPSDCVKSLINLFIPGMLKRSKTVQKFEVEFAKELGQSEAISCSYARTSLYQVLKALELKDNDEVLMTPINIPDMVNMIHLLGLKEKFIDYTSYSTDIDLIEFESLITSKTKIFFYTHLYGRVGNISEVKEICKKNNIFFLMDSTQALGCQIEGQDISSFSDASIYSLCDLKDIQTHKGGMITTNDSLLAKNIRSNRKTLEIESRWLDFLYSILSDLVFSLALKPIIFTLFIYPFLKIPNGTNIQKSSFIDNLTKGDGITLFGHTFLTRLFGTAGDEKRSSHPEELFHPYTELQAQIGLNKLRQYKKVIDIRVSHSRLLIDNLSEETRKYILPWSTDKDHSFWKFPVFVPNKNLLRAWLLKKGYDAAPINLPCIPHESVFATNDTNTPHAYQLKETGLGLPVYHYMTESNVLHLAECLNQYFSKS